MVDIPTDLSLVDETGFAVGDVLGRSLSVFRRDFGKFILVTGIILLPDLAKSLIDSNGGPGNARAATSGWSIVSTALQVFADVAVISAALARMNGGMLSVWDAMREGGLRFRSALFATVLQGVAVVLGLVLLIVPGLIAFAMMYVVLPVCVAEETGATASINRSAALTKGHRWKVFGISLVTGAGAVIMVVVALLAIQFGGPAVGAFVIYLFQIIYLPFAAVVSVVVYRALRLAKEGPTSQTLAEVFA